MIHLFYNSMTMKNKNKQLLLGLSITAILATSLLGFSQFALADQGETTNTVTSDDVSIAVTAIGSNPDLQFNVVTDSVSLYWGAETQNNPNQVINFTIGGFVVDGTAEATLIVSDGQSACRTTSASSVIFNTVTIGTVEGFDGPPPVTCLWDNFTADVTAHVNAGDISATLDVAAINDCLTNQVIIFEEGTNGFVAAESAGVGMRNYGNGTITISGIPANHVPVSSLLFWQVLNQTQPASNNVTINGNNVTEVLIGSDVDPCWGQENAWAFAADVTPYVSGNGSYEIEGVPSGLTNGQDPWAGTVAPLAEGASLVVIHQIDAISAEKSWTHTDYNWDPVCDGIFNVTGCFTLDGTATLDLRPANIFNVTTDDVLADELDNDGLGNYTAIAQVHKDKFKNTNPGAMYALTTIDVAADLDSLTVWEEYGDCYEDKGLLQFVSKKDTRNVKVAVANSTGFVTELSDDIYDGIGGNITSINATSAHIEITDPANLTEGSTVYVLVKFQDDLKNESAPNNEFDEMCNNVEDVKANIGEYTELEQAEASLRITNLE